MRNERLTDEFLELLPLTTEESRVMKILLWFGRPATYDEISEQHTKKFNIKIGNKLYHILNCLFKKKFAEKGMASGKKVFYVHNENLAAEIKKAVQGEMKRAQDMYQKIQFMEKPSLTTYVGEDDVAALFDQIDEMEAKGGIEEHGIIDILSYPVKIREPKKLFIEQRIKSKKHLLELTKQGKLVEYYISEKAKVEKHFKFLERQRGKKYVIEAIKYINKALEFDSFNIMFTNNIMFKFFVIPNKCAVVSWFSSSEKEYLDRAIVFWYPDDIKGLDEYFWNEWKRALNGKTEKEAKEEVKRWAKEYLEKLTG